jgi:uncharacterized iron-regulated protein
MPAVQLLFLLTASLAAAAQSAPAPPPPVAAPAAQSGYVPERVFDTRAGAFSDFELMLADLARADVILVGEQHDDPNTHRLETALLEGLLRRHAAVVVSLEMFERDVQPALDAYLAGRGTEKEFLDASRPWPRYATDYRALIELAKGQAWPVVAANVPRRYASQIARTGLDPLAALPAAERALVAGDLQCPKDAYFDRFAATMGDHPAGSGGAVPEAEAQRAIIERYYQSQCVKDETMAESIAAAFARRGGAIGPIVHITGAFHSDFGTGTAERVRRRLPGRRVAIVTLVPLASLDGLAPSSEDRKRAEYLVYTVK